MFSLKSILGLMKPFLGDIEKKLAVAMAEQDKEYGTKNIGWLIRRVKRKKIGKDGIITIEDVCEMSYIDITDYTAIEIDPRQEYALKALFVKDRKSLATLESDVLLIKTKPESIWTQEEKQKVYAFDSFPNGRNISQGIDFIFSSVTSDKEDED